jgi:hypothetical protein
MIPLDNESSIGSFTLSNIESFTPESSDNQSSFELSFSAWNEIPFLVVSIVWLSEKHLQTVRVGRIRQAWNFEDASVKWTHYKIFPVLLDNFKDLIF